MVSDVCQDLGLYKVNLVPVHAMGHTGEKTCNSTISEHTRR